MLPIFTAYPQFAPNQILTSSHLNQLYDYLGEQERLTRTHLIGIGIVCGLEATLDGTGEQITISRGCGVTSAGHLVIWDEDEALKYRLPYTLPEDLDYPFFDLPGGTGETYPLWELTTDRDDAGEAVDLTGDFLTGLNQNAGEEEEKVLLLLFECRVRDNSNCTPTSCDDKGQTVETTIRPLLIRRPDLEEIRRVLALNNPGVDAYYSLFQTQSQRLGLATLRPPRFDVTNTNPATTRELFETYQAVLSADFLAGIQSVLDAAYTSLAPLLAAYSANPFSSRVTDLKFLYDGGLFDGPEALVYQYYFDHLVTIIGAYEELREQAEDLFGLCCPDDSIFPRHLVLHHFTANGLSDELRHVWVSSPVQNRQAEARRELESLFDRLVALVQPTELPVPQAISARLTGGSRSGNRFRGFREAPPASIIVKSPLQPIRITPSFLGRPLSEKAIPYYYDHTALLEWWNYRLTRRGRATENLGFDAQSWNTTDDFVRQPLVYDLEPRNFLRIEGCVGQPYPDVVEELTNQIAAFRLPVDVVALRTGNLISSLAVEDFDLHFADLEAQYATWRAQLLGRLAEVTVRFYDTKILDAQGNAQPSTSLGTPQAPLLQRLATYQYLRGTVGEFYEVHYAAHTAAAPFLTGLNGAYSIHMLAIHSMVRLEDSLAARLRDLDFDAAETALSNLQNGGRFFGRLAALVLNDAQTGGATTNARVDLEEYSDQLDELVTGGDRDALRALHDTYLTRRTETLEEQLFSKFQEDHPGLQFKAGTELGGTFVLVYHGGTGTSGAPLRRGRFRLAGQVLTGSRGIPRASIVARGSSIGTTTDATGRFSLFVTSLPVTLTVRSKASGGASRDFHVTREESFLQFDLAATAPIVQQLPIPGITDGMVIADFFLPYRCCGGGVPIQIFPPAPPEPSAEVLAAEYAQTGCTTTVQGTTLAPILFSATGGVPPYTITDATGNSEPLPPDPIDLPDGSVVTVSDSDGGQVTLTVNLLPALSVQFVGNPVCAQDNQTFSREITITGGQPPYQFTKPDGSVQSVAANEVVTLDGIPSGGGFSFVVSDEFGSPCTLTVAVPAHSCVTVGPECGLPCGGLATRESYPLWVPRLVDDTVVYEGFTLRVEALSLTTADGNRFELTSGDRGAVNDNLESIFQAADPLKTDTFADAMQLAANSIMKMVDASINDRVGLENDERGLILTVDTGEAIARLTVEHFVCDAFELGVEVKYAEVNSETGASVGRSDSLFYTDEGVRPGGADEPFPTFERFEIDRCNPTAGPKGRCEGEVKVTITSEFNGREAFLSGRPEGAGKPVFWWELPLAEPGVATGESVTARYRDPEIRPPARVLLVDSETGCFAVATNDIG